LKLISRVLTDPVIRRRSVSNKIQPPATRDTTRQKSRVWTQSTEEVWKQHHFTSRESSIIGTARGCLATAAVWRDCPALYHTYVARCTRHSFD